MIPLAISVITITVLASGLWWFKYKRPKLVTDLVFQAKTQNVSFHYPQGWTLKIDENDIGYVFGPKDSWTRMWFSLNIGIPSACETTTGPIEIVTSQPVSLPGLSQQLRYIEAVLPADTDPNKYVVYFGLVPNKSPFDQPQTFVGCLNEVKASIFASGNAGKTIIEFHSVMYANQFDAFTHASKSEALNYFQSKGYKQAKQIILSVAFGA